MTIGNISNSLNARGAFIATTSPVALRTFRPQSGIGDLVHSNQQKIALPLGMLQHQGIVWVITLTSDEVDRLGELLASGGQVLAVLAGPLWPEIEFRLLQSIGYIELIDELFGRNGVEIHGVLGTEGVIVTPRLGKLFGELLKVSQMAVAGKTIIEFVVAASSRVPALGAALGIPVVANVLNAVLAGTPLGVAISAAIGFGLGFLQGSTDPNQHGAVHADRDAALSWESFYLAHLGASNQVALLSWQGYFSAQDGGGRGVYANRPQLGPWETWRLVDNRDGTVSLQTVNGHFLVAEEGGGRECQANRTSIGPWEKFVMVPLNDGRVALQTRDKRKFVSVQQDL